MEVDRHFIKEKLEAEVIKLRHVRSEDQLADILTKAVRAQSFEEVLCKLGVGDPTTQLRGSVRIEETNQIRKNLENKSNQEY